MGAWGIDTFENDDSCDWLFDLEETNDLSLIEITLDEANTEYLESDEASNILAATEIVLALQGKLNKELPEEATEWLNKNKSLDSKVLNTKAITSIDKILSDESELKELWAESEDYKAWLEIVSSLRTKLHK